MGVCAEMHSVDYMRGEVRVYLYTFEIYILDAVGYSVC